MKYNDDGEELPDPIPMEMPLHFKRPESLHEMIARAIRTQMSRDADAAGQETFDEANDFDVMDEDIDPTSRYEIMPDDEFRSVERQVLDKAQKDMDNNDAAIRQRKKEAESADDDRRKAGERKGSADVVQRVSDAREVGAEAGGKGRSAGDSGA